jgi:RNA polymerase sigma-70 factor, ECF subfamily
LTTPGPFPELEPEAVPGSVPVNRQEEWLAAAVLARDRKATAEFVTRYSDRIYSYIRSRLAPNTGDVEDLVQDVFLAAWKGLSSFHGESTLGAWLLGIARHKVQDYYRIRLRAPEPMDKDFAEREEAMLLPEQEQMIDAQRMRERTLRVLEELPEQYRLVLRWRYWEKCPVVEMAARTGKSEKAVERLLARARDQFRRKWRDA